MQVKTLSKNKSLFLTSNRPYQSSPTNCSPSLTPIVYGLLLTDSTVFAEDQSERTYIIVGKVKQFFLAPGMWIVFLQLEGFGKILNNILDELKIDFNKLKTRLFSNPLLIEKSSIYLYITEKTRIKNALFQQYSHARFVFYQQSWQGLFHIVLYEANTLY